jgi:hypothetical protein
MGKRLGDAMHFYGTRHAVTAWRDYALVNARYSQAMVAAAKAVISATS